MKKQFLSIALGLYFLLPTIGNSQERTIPCYTEKAMEDYFVKNPQAKLDYENNQKVLRESLSNARGNQGKAAAFVYTVPVVFHVLHTGGGENVDDATIKAALAQVNKDFARLGNDVNTVAQPFQNLYINSDIEFMLAKKDPQGNCTSGIIHRYDVRTDWDQANTNYYNGITWNPTRYLNIIIVKTIIPNGPVAGGGTIVGYTYKPGTWGTGAPQDAIVYDAGFLSGLQVRSLTHEIGHWLSLSHTFGNTNNPGVSCGDDGILDTPPTKGNYGTCPSSLSGNACAGATTVYAAGQDNVENFMDYSSCPKNFTSGQTTAMRNTLTSVVSNRQNLWQPANLGTNGADVNGLGNCAPIAEFLSTNNSYTVCKGGSLTMKDFSYNGNVTTYQWIGDNGATISSPGSSITAIVFSNLGVSNITLSVSNNTGTSFKVRTVTVLDGTPQVTGNFIESFENSGVPLNWQSVNANPGSGFWDQSYNGYYDGFASFYVNGSLCGPKQEDYLITPVLDVFSNQNNKLEFAYAYKQKVAGHNDILKIQASKDCGGTWQDITNLTANFMASKTGGVGSTPYVPLSTDWAVFVISDYPQWVPFKNYPSVMLRFNFIENAASGSGNNIYIDAVNFYNPNGPDGVNELTKSIELNVFPNPTGSETKVHFVLSDPATIKINITDIYGRVISSVTESKFDQGEQNISINADNKLSKGVYFVNVWKNDAKMSRKLIIN